MTKEDIHKICKKYNITNYTINDDLSIDVDGEVYLGFKNLKELPLKFRNVSGEFDCSWNGLTTLEGSPSKVGGYFDCYDNPLKSLKGIPIDIEVDNLILAKNFTYDDYLAYCRDLKFKKILKC